MRLKKHEVKKGRIEIIPMIDVVFFLLVFSMLSALNMAEINRLQADVPKTGSGSGGEVNRITVNHIKGRVFLTIETPSEMRQQKLGGVAEVEAAVKAVADRNPGVVALVNADDTLPFGQGAAMVDAVKGAGVPLVIPAGEA